MSRCNTNIGQKRKKRGITKIQMAWNSEYIFLGGLVRRMEQENIHNIHNINDEFDYTNNLISQVNDTRKLLNIVQFFNTILCRQRTIYGCIEIITLKEPQMFL